MNKRDFMSTVSNLSPGEHIELVNHLELYVKEHQSSREVTFEELSKQLGVGYKGLEMICENPPD